MKVHRSALKHGVSSEDAAQAAIWPQWIEPLEDDDWPHRELRLGFDTQARLLETVVFDVRRWRGTDHSRDAGAQAILGPVALRPKTYEPELTAAGIGANARF